MRHIDNSNLTISQGWKDKVDKVKQKLKQCRTHDERMELIGKNEIWRELRLELEKCSDNKCWYTEASDKVSNYDVDHFRPKGTIKQYKSTTNCTDGYWWLAYEPGNYRLSGIIPNRPLKDMKDGVTKGKHNYFPIRPGSQIALSENDDEDAEFNYLLDPTKEFDVTLLTFDNTGSAIPSYPNSTWEYERAFVSIELYNLDFYKLKSARKKVWDRCERTINEIQNAIIDRNFGDRGRNQRLPAQRAGEAIARGPPVISTPYLLASGIENGVAIVALVALRIRP